MNSNADIQNETRPPGMPGRLLGLDIARAIAVGGMALIHFVMVLSHSEIARTPLGLMVERLMGRPATLFMILAGIGISLRMRNQGESSANEMRKSLMKRGVFFLVAGTANLILWEGDILRVYGIAYLLASLVLLVSDRQLWMMAAIVGIGFVSCVVLFDFERNWNFETLEYANLGTPSGASLNLFFNGFRSVLPWVGLLFVGMILGRRDLRSAVVRKRIMFVGVLIWAAAETCSSLLLRIFLAGPEIVDEETLVALFGTESLPAMPLFLFSSSGLACVVIAASVHLAEKSQAAGWGAPMASAGQMAFTWYMVHIVVVIGCGLLTRFRGDVPIELSFTLAAGFCFFMIVISWGYRRRYRFGPLEIVLRSVAR